MTVADQIAGGGRAPLPASSTPRELPPMDLDPAAIGATVVRGEPWGEATLDELLGRHDARGIVVLHRGRLAFERYGGGGAADRRNLCFSVTKSFTGLLAATAVHDGRLQRDELVTARLPELAATGFGGATIADLCDMTASIGYDEDYDEAEAPSDRAGWRGFGDYMAALGLDPEHQPGPGQPGSIRALLASIGAGAGPHGEAFAYATPVTDTLGWVVERVHGRDGADVLDAALWSHIGAEHGAVMTRDGTGTALMGAGLAMTTRDLARFGALVAESGRDGRPAVIPTSVVEAVRDGGDLDVFQRGGHYAYLAGYSYRDQWWLPGGASRPLSAWGIHGQVLWVDPDAEVVVAYHCGGPLPSDMQRDLEQDALCRALVEASERWD